MNKALSIIIVLVLLGLGVMGVMYFAKQNKGGLPYSSNESTPAGSTATSPEDNSDAALDSDLGEIKLEDPTGDLKDVDADIKTL